MSVEDSEKYQAALVLSHWHHEERPLLYGAHQTIEDLMQFEDWKVLIAAIGGYARNYPKYHSWWPAEFFQN